MDTEGGGGCCIEWMMHSGHKNALVYVKLNKIYKIIKNNFYFILKYKKDLSVSLLKIAKVT